MPFGSATRPPSTRNRWMDPCVRNSARPWATARRVRRRRSSAGSAAAAAAWARRQAASQRAAWHAVSCSGAAHPMPMSHCRVAYVGNLGRPKLRRGKSCSTGSAPMGPAHGHSSRAAAWAATGRLATSTWGMPAVDPWTQPRSRHAASTETTTAWGQAWAAAAAPRTGTEMIGKPAASVRAKAARDASGSSAASKWRAVADTATATSAARCAVRGSAPGRFGRAGAAELSRRATGLPPAKRCGRLSSKQRAIPTSPKHVGAPCRLGRALSRGRASELRLFVRQVAHGRRAAPARGRAAAASGGSVPGRPCGSGRLGTAGRAHLPAFLPTEGAENRPPPRFIRAGAQGRARPATQALRRVLL